MSKNNSSLFRINVFELLHKNGESKQYSLQLKTPEDIGSDYQIIKSGSEITLDFEINSLVEGMMLRGRGTVPVNFKCTRCLVEDNYEQIIDISAFYPYTLNKEDDEDSGDNIYEIVDEQYIDLFPMLRDAFFDLVLFAPRCSDVPCGNLEEDCQIPVILSQEERDDDIDPRFAVLKDFFK